MNGPGTINLTPGVPTLNGTHLNELLDLYVQSCRQRLDRQATIDGYEYSLFWFKKWWEEEGPDREWLLRPDDFVLFEKYLRSVKSPLLNRPLSYHTRATVIKRLKEMFRWAQDKGYVERDYRKWIPNADGGPPKRKVASISALHQLLNVVSVGRYALRNRAMVAMMIGMGLRRAEITHLDIEDVVVHADHSGHAHVVGKRTKANKTGERDAAFDSVTGEILVCYLDSLGRTLGPLFESNADRRISGLGVYVMLKKAIAKAGLESQIIGPHDLRRAFATHFTRTQRGPLAADILRRQLGHAHYSMTSEYTLLDVTDLEKHIVSPLASGEAQAP